MADDDYKRYRSNDGNDLFKQGNKYWDKDGNTAFQTGNKLWGDNSTTTFNEGSNLFWSSSSGTASSVTGDVIWANGKRYEWDGSNTLRCSDGRIWWNVTSMAEAERIAAFDK